MRLIDADAFLEEARNRIDMQDMYLPIHIKYFVIDEMPTIDAEPIDNAPTIDTEPVSHGRWIECESENGIHIHKCSECGKRDMYKGAFKDFNGRGFSFYYKRQCCPYCGAKMEGEEE